MVKNKIKSPIALLVVFAIILSTIIVGVVATEPPANVLTDPSVVGDLFRIDLATKLTQEGQFNDTEKAKLVYDNLTRTTGNSDVRFRGVDVNDYDNDGNVTESFYASQYNLTNDQVIDGQILSNELSGFTINNDYFGDNRNKIRVAIGFELGADYKLDDFVVTQDVTNSDYNRRIIQSSVYVGDALDETIFQNKAYTVSTPDYDEDTITFNFDEGTTASCILFVFDCVYATDNGFINMHAYTDFCVTNMELHGEKQAPVANNILKEAEVVGDIYKINLPTALAENKTYAEIESSLVYNNIQVAANASDFVFMKKDINDEDNDGNTDENVSATDLGLTDDQVIDQKILTNGAANDLKLEHISGGTNCMSARSALGFDLGGKYDLTNFKLSQTSDRGALNISVYAGNAIDATIFQNKVGVGTVSQATDIFDIALTGATSVRYLLVVFDHCGEFSTKETSPHTYYPTLTGLELYGELVTPAPTSILTETDVVGDLYRIELENALTDGASIDDAAEQAKLSAENYISLNNGDNTKMNFVNGQGTASEDLDPALTDNDVILGQMVSGELEGFRIYYDTAGQTRLENRAAIGFDLGTYYTLDEIVLTKDVALTCRIVQASVYVGDTLDTTIFNNKVGTARVDFADATMKIEFPENTAGKCIVIVFDHVLDPYNGEVIGMWNHTDFSLTNIELYGEKQPVVATNILTETNVVGDLYKIELPEAITDNVAFNATEQAKLVYGENHLLSVCGDESGFIFKGKDGNNNLVSAASLGLTDDQVIDDKIIANNNAEKFAIVSQNSNIPLGNRAALGFDLGAYYDLDELVLTQNFYEGRKIYNFSVYVGNEMDETIYQNQVATGGSATEATLTSTFADGVNGRYVLVVFDHVGTDGTTNRYAYEQFSIGNIELHGEKTGELPTPTPPPTPTPKENVLTNESVVGDLYKIVLPEAITDNVAFNATEQAKLVYGENHALAACGDASGFIFKRKDLNDENSNGKTDDFISATELGLTDEQIIDDKIIANNNTEKFAIVSQNSNIPLGNRAALGFDLGAYYDLDELVITQNFYEGRKIYNFSVYVGNEMDETIFQNKVATGGSTTEEATLTATFNGTVNGRYVLVVFDHVGTDGTTNKYAYEVFSIGNIELHGEKTGELPPPPTPPANILKDSNVTGDLYKIILPEAITHDVEFDATEQAKLVYGDNHVLSVCSDDSDFRFMKPAGEDLNGNGTTSDDYVSAKEAGFTDDQIIDQKILSGNNPEPFIIRAATSSFANQNRAAIGFDLGAYYDMDELVLTQSFYAERSVYNFSVYVGNEMDGTIFQNKVATGGSATKETLTATFSETVNGRYVLVVFDHVSTTEGKTNKYAYEIFSIANVEVYGEKTGELPAPPKNVLLDANVKGDLYKIELPEAITHDVDFNATEQAKLVYGDKHSLSLCSTSGDFRFMKPAGEDLNGDGKLNNDFRSAKDLNLTNDQVIDKYMLTGNNSENFTIRARSSNFANENRVAIGFDMGAYYDMDELVITQGFEESRKIYNYSVYVGNKMDESIYKNKVASGANPYKVDLTSTFADGVNGRYILIVFDFVATEGKTNKYAYEVFWVKNIALYGEKTGELPIVDKGTNVLLGNTSGRVHQVNSPFIENLSLYVPNYDNLTYTKLYDNDSSNRFRTELYDPKTQKLIKMDQSTDEEPNPDAINDPSLKYITDGTLDEEVLIRYTGNHTNGFVENRRSAIMYDLGAWYDLNEVVITQNVDSRSIRNYSVYAGAFTDSRLLSSRVGVGGGTSEVIPAELTDAKNVRYLLIVFDNITETTIKEANVWAYQPYLLQIEAYGKKLTNPIIPFDYKSNDILENNENIKFSMALIEHEFSWTDSFEKGSYDYAVEDFSLQSEMDVSVYGKWVDGKADTTAYWAHGISSKQNITHRRALMIDLGGFYDVNELVMDAMTSTGRYIYDFTVYGGMVADASIMNNRIGHGGDDGEFVSSILDSKKSVRYILIVFNKQGTDPGNLDDDGRSLRDQIDTTGALKGCTWADAGVYIGDISLYGKEGVDTTETLTYTDPDTGIKVEVITYDNPVSIASIAIKRTPISDIHKGMITLDAMYPLGDGYRIEFYDKQGNLVTDMSGRQFKVSFPMEYGDEVAYTIDEDGSLRLLNLALDMDEGTLVYASSPNDIIFDFIIASYTEPETEDDGDKSETDKKDGGGLSTTALLAIVIAGAVVIIAGAITVLLIVLKRRKNNN